MWSALTLWNIIICITFASNATTSSVISDAIFKFFMQSNTCLKLQIKSTREFLFSFFPVPYKKYSLYTSHLDKLNTKGQIMSECIYEIIDFPKYQRKILIDFCPESLFINFRLQREIYKTLQMSTNFKYHSSKCIRDSLLHSF